MSDHEPHTLQEELEVRIIALLTGELPESEADELEKILSVDEALVDFRDRMARLIGDVHAARDEITTTPAHSEMRLSPERRREIFTDEELFDCGPSEDEKKKWWRMGLLELVAVFAIAGVLAAILIPSVGAVRKQASSSRERMVESANFEAPMEEQVFALQDRELVAPPVAMNAPSRDGSLARRESDGIASDRYSGRIMTESEAIDQVEYDSFGLEAQAAGGGMAKQHAGFKKTEESLALGADYAYDAQAEAEPSSDASVITITAGTPQDLVAWRQPKGAIDPVTNPSVITAPITGPRLSGGGGRSSSASASMDPFAAPTTPGPVDPFAAPSRSREVKGALAQGRMQYLNGDYEGAGASFDKVTVQDPSNAEAKLFKEKINEMHELHARRPGQTRQQMLAQVGQAWERPKVFDVDSNVTASPMYSSMSRDRLKDTVIPEVRFKSMPLSRVLETLSELSVEYDSESQKTGINIIPLLDAENDPEVTLNLKGASLGQILEEVSKLSGSELIKTSEFVAMRNVKTPWNDLAERNGKMQAIVIPQVNFSGMPLSEVVDVVQQLSVEYDPYQVGVRLDYTPINGDDPRVNISLRNLSLDRILQFVTQQVNHEFVVMGDRIQIQPQGHSTIEQMAQERLKNTAQRPKAEMETSIAPISTFSLNVSDVSFKLAEAALASQRIPSAELIRTEEFVNSFNYGDPAPREDEPVTLNWEIAQHPYQHNRQIVRFSLQTQAAGRAANQPLNLNLLVDNSGSMQRPDRRSILEQSLQSLQSKLTDQDQLNIVLFARQPTLIASASNVHDQKIGIERALNAQPQGGTNLESGLQVAYNVAQRSYDPTASNRVILMTDGAANLGDVDSSSLAQMVVEQRKQGIALDAYGIGWEDYNDALLEEITRNGDGRYAFLNSVDSAAEDFAEKLAGTLRVAAADVKVQILWNPERVTAYRQIGYDLHQLRAQDFRDNTVDAAEIGEAESGTALYVLQINDDPEIAGGLGKLQVRYRVPATGEYIERAWPLEMPRKVPALQDAPASLRLAAASALFAERLANNPYAGNYSFEDLEALSAGLPEAFPTQARVSALQNMIQSANALFTRLE